MPRVQSIQGSINRNPPTVEVCIMLWKKWQDIQRNLRGEAEEADKELKWGVGNLSA